MRAKIARTKARRTLARVLQSGGAVFVGTVRAVANTVVLDGSEGEGGGQILRTALSLSLITQRPFEIRKIRANRKPAGLRPQHLAGVRGAEAISSARSEGAEVKFAIVDRQQEEI